MSNPAKRLAILGSTGSIGRQTLEVVRALAPRFRVVALAAGNNAELLARHIQEFDPQFVHCLAEIPHLPHDGSRAVIPPEEMASHPDVDMVVVAMSGKAGLAATLAAARAGKSIALANKESLVMAGQAITREARQSRARILPIDSEHSAIWQCLRGEEQAAAGIAGIILTASGGPFRGRSRRELEAVTAADALRHPSWRMGPKVTVDSATLMNKGLEVIEARWLFDVPIDRIRIVVHPQSIIHSMVEFADGSVKAQLSLPDMRLPIQYALTYPERVPNPELESIDWSKIEALTFETPDMETFPCLGLAIEAGKTGGTQPAVLCAADEAAVDLFLADSIRFTDIARLVGDVLAEHDSIPEPGIDDISAADEWAGRRVRELAGKRAHAA